MIRVNELQLSKDLNVITAEINAYQRIAGEAIFEIGRRLKHVKENDLAHGEFGKWHEEELGISRRMAQMFIKVAEEFEGNTKSVSHLGIATLYQIATLPPEQRYVPHELPSGETKKPEDMTVRELRELKRKLREEKEAKEQAQREAEQARKAIKQTKDYKELKAELEEKKNELTALTQEQIRLKNRRIIYNHASKATQDIGKTMNQIRLMIHERGDVAGDKEVYNTLNAFIKTLREAIEEVESWLEIDVKSDENLVVEDNEVVIIDLGEEDIEEVEII